MPLPFCLALLIAGWWCGRSPLRARLGRSLFTASLALLLLFSNTFVSTELITSLESRFPPIPELRAGETPLAALASCHWVVVLGGGHIDVLGLAALDKLSASSLARLTEGVRVLRSLPAARLIVSGPAVRGHPAHAAILAQAAVSLGVPRGRIVLIVDARDTEDESFAVKRLVGEEPVALVTSAWHMPRAAALFRRAGVNIVPCPTDYNSRPIAGFAWENFHWDVESLERSTWALHEYAGLLWNRLKSALNLAGPR
jgi:uncharacterized SAM-binding protein YcdF (DUF218 family)